MQTQTKWIDRYSIYTIFALVNIAYLPGIVNGPAYKYVTTPLYALIALLCIRNYPKYGKTIYKTISAYALFVICVSALSYTLCSVFPFAVTTNVFMAMICFFAGYSLRDKSESFIKTACYVYAICALFLGLYSVFKITGGFVIANDYLFLLKNSSGALLGTCVCVLLCLIANSNKRIEQIFLILATILILACIMTFRSRTSLIAVGIVLIVTIINRHTFKSILSNPTYFFLAVVGVVSIIIYDIIPSDFIFDALTANKDLNDANDISSGRLDIIERSLRYFHNDMLFGASGDGIKLKSIDCMPVAILCKNGLIGAALVYPVYFLLWWIALKGCIKACPKKMLPYAILLFLCITSLSEETYPFGPGTPVVGGFIFLGIAMSNQSNAFFNFYRDVRQR